MIREEEKYDGFYAIATNLDAVKDYKEIIEINSNRYKIEDCFRVLKTHFKARPVNHSKKSQDHSTFHDLLYSIIDIQAAGSQTQYKRKTFHNRRNNRKSKKYECRKQS